MPRRAFMCHSRENTDYIAVLMYFSCSILMLIACFTDPPSCTHCLCRLTIQNFQLNLFFTPFAQLEVSIQPRSRLLLLQTLTKSLQVSKIRPASSLFLNASHRRDLSGTSPG